MALANGATGRVEWIDAARGIGIVLVVLGHVEGGLIDAGIQSQSSWIWPGYAIYAFHMPLFFLLAGLNVPHSLAKGSHYFLWSKLWTIAFPYVLWSLIQGSVLVAASSFTNGHTHVSDLLSIGWRPLGQFWFLYVLMICQLAALVLKRRRGVMVGIAIVAYAASTLLQQGGIVEELLHSFPFFVAGILLSDRIPAGGTTTRNLAYALGGAIGLVVAAALSGLQDGMNFDSPLALPASICGIVMVVSLARALAGSALYAAASLGRMSMTIYVMHVLAAAGTRILFVKLHVPANPGLYVVACTFVGIAAPVLAHLVLARLNSLALLGLAPSHSRRIATPLPA